MGPGELDPVSEYRIRERGGGCSAKCSKKPKEDISCFGRLVVLGGGFKASPESCQVLVQRPLSESGFSTVASFEPDPEVSLDPELSLDPD